MLDRGLSFFAVAAFAVWLCSPAVAQEGMDCKDLADFKVEDTNLLSSAVVAAADDLPEYCRVLGYVRPAINFEIRLPTSDWNSKFYMTGCGSWCGRLRSDRAGFSNAPNHGLRRHYATATTDLGHWGTSTTDTRWLQVRDPIARFDFAQRGNTETARVAKEVIAAYYGKPAERSYFAGCSTGGRQAHVEAVSYPEDFDGIISGCPFLYAAPQTASWAWNALANTGPDGGPVFPAAKLPVLVEAVYGACAGEDGLIENPEECAFEPADIACDDGSEGSTCLTAAEVATVEKLYAGPRTSGGEQIFPRLPRGSEPYWVLWRAMEDEATWQADRATIEAELRYFSFPENRPASWTLDDFDFDEDPQSMTAAYADMEGSGTDLSKFRERGGKLLVYHGLADSNQSPAATLKWYGELAAGVGGEASAMEFVRLFLVPGMDHCGIQSGPGVADTGFDPLPALEAWVEKGIPPESIVMTKTDDTGATEWTRPVCVYPNAAEYNGSGDIGDAMSWSCQAGTAPSN